MLLETMQSPSVICLFNVINVFDFNSTGREGGDASEEGSGVWFLHDVIDPVQDNQSTQRPQSNGESLNRKRRLRLTKSEYDQSDELIQSASSPVTPRGK